MAKITLVPNPTFQAKVAVPVPGQGDVDVVFTFKHRTRDEMQRFLKEAMGDAATSTPGLDDEKLVMACACGWELADAFDEKNVAEFARQYIAGPTAVFETYCRELSGARLKNFDRPRY